MKPETRRFHLKVIGTIYLEPTGADGTIQLKQEYRPALLHLEKFSHAILFFNLKEQLSKYVVVLQKVSMEKGELQIQFLQPINTIEPQIMLYDIKPYFPCEDNVIPFMEEKISEHTESEEAQPIAITSLQPFEEEDIKIQKQFQEESVAELRTIQSCGKIRTIQGKTYLVFDKDMSGLKTGYVRILWWFHRFDQRVYRRHYTCNPPYENAPETGIFASRSPVRPNPIAMTTAKILAVEPECRRIEITKIDAFDDTFVLGVVPYQFEMEAVGDAKVPVWLEHWPNCYQEPKAECGLPQKQSILQQIKQKMNHTKEKKMMEPKEQSKIENSRNRDSITVTGARQNNLKNLSLRIPYHKVIAVTGVSGSGKTSLVFDTIYAESQRRFLANMSMPGMDQVRKPEVDEITGLPPAIAISQTEAANQPRSTVGTYTDTYDLLCRIFAAIGIRHCPECGSELFIYSEDKIYRILKKLQKNGRVIIAPYGSNMNVEKEDIDKNQLHQLLQEGKGAIQVCFEELSFLLQTKQICYPCNQLLFEMTPSLFKYNQPESMCPHCKGLGIVAEVSIHKIITNETISILDGASPWWRDLRKFIQQPSGNWMKGEIVALAKHMEVDLETPWNQLPEEFRKKALYGSDGEEIEWEISTSNGRSGRIVRPVSGAVNHIQRLYYENEATAAKTTAQAYMEYCTCPTCQGERLAKEGRFVTVAETRIPELTQMSFDKLLYWIEQLPEKLEGNEFVLIKETLTDLRRKLLDMKAAGLGYLTLNRSLPTLSGGEFGRLRFVSQLRNGLSNLLYILDEPSKGLHPKDYGRLLSQIQRLKEDGNTILLVEHTKKFIEQSDYLIEIGPKAGNNGGNMVVQGETSSLLQKESCIENSETLQYLKKRKQLHRNQQSMTEERVKQTITQGKGMEIKKIKYHNLNDVTMHLPLNQLTCISGVSGSGKSSLFRVILRAITEQNNIHENEEMNQDTPMSFQIGTMPENVNVEWVTQKPIGKTSRSTPATYSGLLDCLRMIYASIPEAKTAQMTQQHFSYNTAVGQCDSCKGTGEVSVFQGVSSQLYAVCPICHGSRYQREVLGIKYFGKSIAEVLSMSAEEAEKWLCDCQKEETNSKRITLLQKAKQITHRFQSIGLGYLILGQSSNHISGGEAQRMKLMNHLEAKKSNTIFLLDEPTTGLHEADIQNFLKVIDQLIDCGNTVIMIEHNPEVLRLADYIIDMGPEGGDAGGRLIACGSVDEIKRNPNSITGTYLA